MKQLWLELFELNKSYVAGKIDRINYYRVKIKIQKQILALELLA